MTEDNLKISAQKLGLIGRSTENRQKIDRENLMTNDRGYDWDNRWGVGFELGQKAYYSNYSHVWGMRSLSFISYTIAQLNH